MKKRLLWLTAILAGVILAIGLTTASAKAEDHQGGDHCICGAVHQAYAGAGHTDAMKSEGEWTEVADLEALKAAVAAGGRYYLGSDITLDGTLNVSAALNLCLNGHVIYGSPTARMFDVAQSSSLNITNCGANDDTHGALDAQNAAGATVVGHHVGVTGNATAVKIGLYNVTLLNASASASDNKAGAAIYMNKGNGSTSAVLVNVTIHKCYARSPLWFHGSSAKLYIDGCTFENLGRDAEGTIIGAASAGDATTSNSATSGGGAISCGATSRIYFYNSTIRNCASYKGGAVFLTGGSQFHVVSGTIENCEATVSGGAFHVERSDGTGVFLEGGTIRNCSAPYGGAAAIYSYSNTTQSFNMSGDAVIENCHAGIQGGAVYVQKAASINITGGTIRNCYTAADGKGGAITFASQEDGAAANISNLTIKDCGACTYTINDETVSGETLQAGAIYNLGVMTLRNCTIEGCKAKGYGGAIRVDKTTAADLKIYASTFKDCATYGTQGGGAICSAGGPLLIDGSTFENCHCYTADGSDPTGNGMDGGAIYKSYSTLTIQNNSKITKCSAWRGGAIFSNADTDINITDTVIGGSAADGNYAYGQGGSITIDGPGTTTIGNGAEVSYGSGVHAGNIAQQTGGTLKITGTAKVTNGTARSSYAGNIGIYSSSGTKLIIEGGEIRDGSAVTLGGNIYLRDANAEGTMTGGVISGGTAGTNGGGICINSGSTFTMTGGTIGGSEEAGNTAAGRGGSIYSENGTINLNGGTVSYGTAGATKGWNGGGNIGVYGANVKLNINGATIANGTAPYGGNIAVQTNAVVTMESGTITEGIATCENTSNGTPGGGNIALVSGTVTLSGGTVSTGKSLKEQGNNLQLTGGTMTIDGATVLQDADDATGSWSIKLAGGTLNIKSGEVKSTKKGNLFASSGTANVSGGEIFQINEGGACNIYAAAKVNVTGGKIYNGLRASGGGNIFVNGSAADVTISGDAEIYGGKANTGGNVGVASGTLTVTGGEIHDGYALTNSGFGGNVYASGGTLAFDGAKVYNGQAKVGGNMFLSGTSATTVANTEFYGAQTTDSASAIQNVYVWQSSATAETKPVLTVNAGAVFTGSLKEGYNTQNVAANGGRIEINGGTFIGSDRDVLTNTKANTELVITGGYIGSMANANVNDTWEYGLGELPAGVAGSVSGGYFVTFVTAPRADVIAEGKAALRGSFANTEQSGDATEYLFVIDDETKGVLIDGDAEIDVAGVSASVAGTGLYLLGQQYNLSVAELNGFTFEGWYEGETKVSADYEISGTADAGHEFIAKFTHPDGTVLLVVTGKAFDLTIGDGEAASYTKKLVTMIPAGSIVKLTYTADEEARFAAWLNESNKLLSEEMTYSTTIYSATTLKASSSTKPGIQVFFYTEYNQLYATLYAAEGELSGEIPATPLRIGATAEWDKTEAQILEEASTDVSSIKVTLVTTPAEEAATYTVTVKKDGETVFTNSAAIGKAMNIALPETEGFFCVKDGDKVISYAPAFDFKASEDKELTAVYAEGEKQSVVTVTSAYGTVGGITFAATRTVIDADAVVEQGILYSVTEIAEAAFTKGASGVGAAVSSSLDNVGTTSLNIKTSAPKTVYVRAYVVLRHADGTVDTIYSEIASASSTAE